MPVTRLRSSGLKLRLWVLALGALPAITLRVDAQRRPTRSVEMSSASSARLPVRAAKSIRVSQDRSENPFFETALAVDPADPRHLVGAGIEFLRDGTAGISVYTSWNDGRTWTRGMRLGTDSTIFAGFDPVVLFGPGGIPYLARSDEHVHVHRSLDGGKTWLPGAIVPGGAYDREYVAVDRTGGYRGRMYLVGLLDDYRLDGSRMGTIGLSISTDSGRTFGEARRLTEAGGASVMAMDLVVAPDGTILIPYKADPLQRNETSDSTLLRIMQSVDGGATFTRSSEVASITLPTNLRGRAQSISPNVPMAIDTTEGRFAGNMYLAWSEYDTTESGRAFRVKVASSADAGRSWRVTAVSDDAQAADQTTAAISVNQDGVVGVTWYDRRVDPTGGCQQLYFAASLDGGATFTPNLLAGTMQPLCPSAAVNWIPKPYAFVDTDRPLSPDGRPVHVVGFFSPTARFRNGGDTQGLVTDTTGRFRAFWIGPGRTNVAQLMFTTITIDSGAIAAARNSGTADVTAGVRLNVGTAAIDTVAHTIAVRVSLTNETRYPIRLPITLTLVAWQTALEGLRAVDAENQSDGIGARWTMEALGKSLLAPNQRSAEKVLTFRYRAGSPAAPNAVEPLRLAFRVTAESTGEAASGATAAP